VEIRLAKLYDNFPEGEIKVELLDTVSVQQFELFERAISTLEELHSVRRLRDFVELNDEELIEMLNSALQELLKKSVSWVGVKRKDTEHVFLNLNRLLLNYLSSIRTFIDHSNAFVVKKFGENSEQHLELKSIFSFFYDNSFAYRFFYKLRNYSQHIGIPVDSLSFTTNYDREENKIHGNLSVKFDRNKLLKNYNSWGTVKYDLKELDEEFDVTPLIFEMTHNIKEIERNIEIIQKEELLRAAKFVVELTAHLQDNKGEVFVAYDFKENDKKELTHYSSVDIPFDIIDFILNDFQEKK